MRVCHLLLLLKISRLEGLTFPKENVLRKSQHSMSSRSEMSEMMKVVRNQMSENEDVDLVMQALRGTNINDDDLQVQGLEMRLVDVGDGVLPLYYDPKALKEFFSARPLAVLTRIFQVITVAGGIVLKTTLDQALGRLKNNPDLEVKRASELRDTITSLGPMVCPNKITFPDMKFVHFSLILYPMQFIKLGQALSIRPDVLSPRSMVELQKLCDKVPSYPSEIAFKTIKDELGKSPDEIFSEITPEPVAAASLGQVYKARLRETGEVVAVKVSFIPHIFSKFAFFL
jgi:aarF domain-containing kinase